MKIVVTGGRGFIGSHFVQKALKLGHDVVDFDKMTYAANEQLPWDYHKNYKFIQKDINDIEHLPPCDVLVNFAAESHVDNSIVAPDVFFKSNTLGVKHLLELIRGKVYGKPLFIQISCYDEQTRALTEDGLKYFWEIKKGDKVLSINPKDGNIEKQLVEKVIVQDYEGDMINFNSSMSNLSVTPNHRMFYRKIKNGKIEIKEADKLYNKTTNQYFLKGQKTIGLIDNIQIGNSLYDAKDVFYLMGIYIGDGHKNRQLRQIKIKSGLNREEYLTKCRNDKGQFISKNSVGKNKYSISDSHRIFLEIPEGDKARKRTINTLDNLGIKYSLYKKNIYFSSKEWFKFFDQFGSYAWEKVIPNWVFEYNNDNLQCLFDGIIDSDGSWISGKRQVLTTTSFKLVEQMMNLGICLGKHVRYSFNKMKPTTLKEGRIIISKHQSYDVYFKEGEIRFGKHTSFVNKYKGKIWCLKVTQNKNFFVERKGLVHCSGNTDEVYGDIREEDGEYTEKDILSPSNPYSASKAAAEMIVMAYGRTFDIEYLITRSSNNYGPRQYEEKLIPVVMQCLMQNKSVPIHGDGSYVRDWLYVKDNIDAIFMLIDEYVGKKKKMADVDRIWNISAYNHMSNINVVREVHSWLKKDEWHPKYINRIPNRIGQDMRYSINSEKIRSLGWKPKYDKGLYNWLKDPIGKHDI